MSRFSANEKRLLVVIGVLVLMVGSLFYQKFQDRIPQEELTKISLLDETQDVQEPHASMEEGGGKIYVHISGAVARAGLLELKEGDRLVDAIDAAGGAIEGADLNAVNLSQKLTDESRIHIPLQGEEQVEGLGIMSSTSSAMSEDSQGNKININHGTKEELMTLPGIGDKTADKIIQYRESQSFGAIEDIKEVSGIGEKKFEDIKDKISI